jgi:hypothetical protein
MPVWPLLVALTLFLALGAGRSGSVSGARTRSTLLLLAAPPVVHSLLFPAGMLLHSYWLFALPAALAAGLGIGLARLNPVACLAGVLLAAAGFVGRVESAREEIDLLPSLLGQAVASETRPGEGVLTNFEVNVLWDGMAVGEYIVIRPEVTFYADRPVRGGVRGRARDEAVDLAGARRLLPAARWFLLWPDPIGDPLLHDSLIALGGPEPELLSGEPPVLFFRLPP